MNLAKKLALFGLMLASLNSLSCKKESATEVIQEVDHLKPLLGSWIRAEHNGVKLNLEHFIIKITFNDETGYGRAYSFSYNPIDPAYSKPYFGYKAKIEELTDKKYKFRITHRYGNLSPDVIGITTSWNYYVKNNRLYEIYDENNVKDYRTYVRE